MPALLGLIAIAFVITALFFTGIGFQTMGVGTGITSATKSAEQVTASLPTLVMGIGLIITGCFFAIMARIAQAAAVDFAAILRRRDAVHTLIAEPLSDTEREREVARLTGS